VTAGPSLASDDWDAHWGEYASAATDNPAQRFRRTVAFDLLAAAGAPVRLLDIGAGQGDLLASAHIAWPAAELAGVELSATGVAETSRKVRDAIVLQGNLLHGPPADARLQAWATHAVCSEVLEHVDDPALLLRNALPLVAPGGRVVVTVPGGPRSAFDKHIGHRQHFDRASLTTVLTAAGLRDVRVEAAGFPVFNLYKLVVIARGKRLIEDAKASGPSASAGLAMKAFDRLFALAHRRGRLGWQLVASARVP
jgi:SAM-dependent methyltransferase